MAVIGTIVTGTTINSSTVVYTSSGSNAVTCIAVCNVGSISLTDETSQSVDVNIYIVSPAGGGNNTVKDINGSLIVKQLTI